MKRSIRAAAVLCAVAVALSVLLAGCKNEDETNDNGSNGLGGHVGTNPFKGLTIVYEDESWSETFAFTSDTKGTYTWSGYEETERSDFEYAVDSTKGLLKYRITTYTDDDGEPFTLDDYIAEDYGELDKETKALVYEVLANNYVYYKFSDDRKAVDMNSSYYFGSMAGSDASFYCYNDTGNGFDFGRHMWVNITRDNTSYDYEGFAKFSGRNFTAVIFVFDDSETDTESYRKFPIKLAGTYQISGTGTNCTGTVTFTQLPDELKGAFDVSKPYTVTQYDEYTTYTVKN